MSKLLSWRMIPSATAGSTVPRGGSNGDRPAGVRQHQPVAAHAAGDGHRRVRQPEAQRERARSARGRPGRGQLVHAQEEGARALRLAPGDQQAAARTTSGR